MTLVIHRALRHPVLSVAYQVVDGAPLARLSDALERAESVCGVSVWPTWLWTSKDSLDTDYGRMFEELALEPSLRTPPPRNKTEEQGCDTVSRFLSATMMALSGEDFSNDHLLLGRHGFIVELSWRGWGGCVAEWTHAHLGAYGEDEVESAYMDWYMIPRHDRSPVEDYQPWRDAMLAAVELKAERRREEARGRG